MCRQKAAEAKNRAAEEAPTLGYIELRGRRSVPDAAITLPIACCQWSPSVRMRSSPMMAFGTALLPSK
jgi:hypothetical protein